MRNGGIDDGSMSLGKSRENSIVSDDSPAGVRMVARVTVPDKGIMCGHANL
jgi:hypothetical protein